MLEADKPFYLPLRDKCVTFLVEKGYRPKWNSETKSIFFKKEGVAYYVDFFETPIGFGYSETHFTIYTIVMYAKTYLNRAEALELANYVNQLFTDAKVAVIDAEVSEKSTGIVFKSECHCSHSFGAVFEEKMESIKMTVGMFSWRLSDQEE